MKLLSLPLHLISLSSSLEYFINKIRVRFNVSCLKQDKPTLNHGKVVNTYIIYKINSNLNNFSFALEDFLFGAVKLTKNSDIDKHKYSGYDIGFDSRGRFLFPDDTFAQNVVFLELI